MKVKIVTGPEFYKSALGAALTVFCGLLLWKMPLGEAWVNASYDYLFRFGAHAVTNKVVVILMDNEAYDHFHQDREQPWDRAQHAQLLNRLADDGAALVVFDVFFRTNRDPANDEALAKAMRRQRAIVLMAEQAELTLDPTISGAHPTLPSEPFLSAAGTNWGVGWLDPDLDSTIVRRHWPFPSPGHYPSLPETAARMAGAQWSEVPRQRWLRYYGRDGARAWTRLSYRFALDQATNYFRDRIVFIGAQPKTTLPGDEKKDEFSTPYTGWTNESTGGVEIQIVSFLNLMNHDWLERPAWWLEVLGLIAAGTVLGGALCRLRPLTACATSAVVALTVALGAVSWSYFTDSWFPWLVIAGGQVPFALAWSLITSEIRRTREIATATALLSKSSAGPAEAPAKAALADELPEAPDYELVHPPFGQGAYGKVWLARNAIGQWQALKVVYLANFGNNADPYDREFNGISRYKPVSDKHPGLLRVDFVSRKREKYFYYVMELGDALNPGWERAPSTYKPRDLGSERARSPGRRLPVRECIRIGLGLTDALDFLHRECLTHRDIKPQNIIFVNGQPKLADVGLIAEIRPPEEERTFVGTPGYMPPPPERPGTPQADIYALGMVLYVLSTGRNAAFFPDIATTLFESKEPADFLPLNSVILKACQPDCTQRYTSVVEMHRDLQHALKVLGGETAETTEHPSGA